MQIKIIVICSLISFCTFAKNEHNLTMLELFIDKALQSNSINKIIVAGLISKSYDLSYSNEQLYKKALKLNPNNILLLEQMIRHCHNNNGESFCKREKYVKKLLNLDSDNALPYLYASIYYDKQGQYNKALENLKIGASKNFFEAYLWKNFALTREELTTFKYPEDEILVVAIQTAQIGSFRYEILVKAINLCVDKSKDNNNWRNSCIDFGELMEVHSKMVLTAFIGFDIQKGVLKNQEQDLVNLENVNHRRDVYHQFRIKVVDNLIWASMLGFENEIPKLFWNELFHYGERVAYQRALDRFLKTKNEN